MRKLNWKHGLFRLWLVVSLTWIGLTGWGAFVSKPLDLELLWPPVHPESGCWNQLAKWPDGQPFNVFEAWGEEVDVPENVEINKKNHAWSAESIPVRNSWRRATLQKVAKCEAAVSFIQRLSVRTTDIANDVSVLKEELLLIFLPPLVLLIVAHIFMWVVRGFRVAA